MDAQGLTDTTKPLGGVGEEGQHSPKSKDIRLFRKGQLVFLRVGRELTDDFWGQVTQPTAGDPQLVLASAGPWREG